MTKFQKGLVDRPGQRAFAAAASYFALTRAVDHYLNDSGLARTISKKTAVMK